MRPCLPSCLSHLPSRTASLLQSTALASIRIDRLLHSPTLSHPAPPHAPPHAPPTYPCVQAKVLETIRIDRLDLGTRPPRVDCFKSFETAEDELIIEVSGRWILRHGCCGVLCMLRVLWVLWVLWCCRCWPLRCLPAAKAAS